jgi:hypothetical protein
MKRFDQTADVDLDVEFGFTVEPVGICFEGIAYAAGSSVNAFPEIEVFGGSVVARQAAMRRVGRPQPVRGIAYVEDHHPANACPVDVAAESRPTTDSKKASPRGRFWLYNRDKSPSKRLRRERSSPCVELLYHQDVGRAQRDGG